MSKKDLTKEIEDEFRNYETKPINTGMPLKRDEISSIEYLKAIDHSVGQISNIAEFVFLKALHERLLRLPFSITFYFQSYYWIPLTLAENHSNGAIKAQLLAAPNWKKLHENSIRRPDFAIPQYGIVIEVDGSIHENFDCKINKDVTREAEYALLDLNLFRISNDDVFNFNKLNYFLTGLINYIVQVHHQSDFKQKASARRQKLKRARDQFKNQASQIDLAKFDNKWAKEQPFPYIKTKAQPSNGGWKFEIKKGQT